MKIPLFPLLLALIWSFSTTNASVVADSSIKQDTLARYLKSQVESLRLELKYSQAESLAAEAREMRDHASNLLGWMVGGVEVLVGLIAILLAVAGGYWFKTQRQVREEREEAVKRTIDDTSKELRPRIEVILTEIRDDAQKRVEEDRQKIDLGPITEKLRTEQKAELVEHEKRLKALEQAGGQPTAQDYILRGRRLLDVGLFDAALEAFNAAIAWDNKSDVAWFGRGYCLAELKRYEEAIAAYDAVLKIKPDDHEALNNKGYCLANLGRDEEAVAAFDAALKIKPDDHQKLSNKGGSLAALGRHEEANAALDIAIKIKPDYPHAFHNKGNSLATLGRREEAAEAYYAAARLHAAVKNMIEMLDVLRLAIENNSALKARAQTDEAFDAFKNDEDFKKLVSD